MVFTISAISSEVAAASCEALKLVESPKAPSRSADFKSILRLAISSKPNGRSSSCATPRRSVPCPTSVPKFTEISDFGNCPVVDRHISVKSGLARPVNHLPVFYDEVVHECEIKSQKLKFWYAPSLTWKPRFQVGFPILDFDLSPVRFRSSPRLRDSVLMSPKK